MISRLMFTQAGRRFDAMVDHSADPPLWVVSIDHGPYAPAFPAEAGDGDGESFIQRLAAAALEKSSEGRPPPDEPS